MPEKIRIPTPYKLEAWLKVMYHEKKIVPVSQLKDKKIYAGSCRNASVAIWDAKKRKFTYARDKFGNTFLEDINCLEEDDGYDLFVPQRLTDERDKEQVDILKGIL